MEASVHDAPIIYLKNAAIRSCFRLPELYRPYSIYASSEIHKTLEIRDLFNREIGPFPLVTFFAEHEVFRRGILPG